MFVCEDCGAEFEKPDTMYDPRPIGFERFSVCPCCSSTNFDEADEYNEEDEEAWDDE